MHDLSMPPGAEIILRFKRTCPGWCSAVLWLSWASAVVRVICCGTIWSGISFVSCVPAFCWLWFHTTIVRIHPYMHIHAYIYYILHGIYIIYIYLSTCIHIYIYDYATTNILSLGCTSRHRPRLTFQRPSQHGRGQGQGSWPSTGFHMVSPGHRSTVSMVSQPLKLTIYIYITVLFLCQPPFFRSETVPWSKDFLQQIHNSVSSQIHPCKKGS